MFKKLTSIVLGALMVSLMVTGLAFADEGAPTGANSPDHRPQRRGGGGGEITAIGTDNFTVTGPRGNAKTFYVDSATEFLGQETQSLTFTDLAVGQRAAVVAAREEGDKTIAIRVRVFPPRTDYKGFGTTDYKGFGTVDSVNATEQAFHFTSRRGKTWEFYVDEQTQYNDREGGTHTFNEVRTGGKVFVKAELRADGKWWATIIGFPPQNAAPQP